MFGKSKDKTLVTFLLDRTGSMAAVKDDTMGAFNAYLDELEKGGGDIAFSLLQFDSSGFDTVCVRQPLRKVPRLNNDNFIPRDMTPLIDAAVKTIKAVDRSLDEFPAGKVVVCILTDGHENASREYTWKELSGLVKEKREAGWQFNFMGAGIDAYDQGAQMGIKAGETVSYGLTPQETQSAFAATASNTRLYSGGLRGSTAYTEDQKDESGDRFRRKRAADDFDL